MNEWTCRQWQKHRLSWFPWYPADYFGDREAKLMTHEEKGVYLDLLSHSWDDFGVPLDTELRARLVGIPREKMEEVWPAMAKKWVPGEGKEWSQFLFNPRIETERMKAIKKHRQQVNAGRASGQARQRKGNGRSTGVGTGHPTEGATGGQPLNSTQETKTPLTPQGVEVEKVDEVKEKQLKIPEALDTKPFRKVWGEWVEYRRKFKKPKGGWQDFLTRQLAKLSEESPTDAVARIQKSLLNGWQGLWFDNEHGNGAPKPEDSWFSEAR